jgi:hypothetical protein
MRLRIQSTYLAVLAVPAVSAILLGVPSAPAYADRAPADEPSAPAGADPAAAPAGADPAGAPAAPPDPAVVKVKAVEYGVGIRLRSIRAPAGMIEWFLESAPGGVSNTGLGIDLVRRRGNTELQLGIEYERIEPAEGVWIESNSNVAAGDEADFIVGPDNNGGKRLGWLTLEFTFLNHTPLHEKVALRYGAGLGIGFLIGELGRHDVFCNGATNENPEPGCRPSVAPFNGAATPTGERPGQVVQYELPPVFPVLNAIIGLQIRPVRKATINIEGGIRTFPFFGISGGYFF